MDKEFLEKRLFTLNQQLNQALANYNAVLGAKTECEHMLAELAKLAEVPKEAA